MVSATVKAGVVGVVLLLFVSVIGGVVAYEQVPEGHQGVEKSWGAVTGEILDSGAHWKVPVMQSVQAVETRPRTYTMTQTQGEGDVSSADAVRVKTVNGSSVDVDITVRYRIRQSSADQFVSEWNNEEQMEDRLIRPTIRTQLRDEASSLETTGDGAIYTQEGRDALETTATEALEREFEGQPIVLEAVQIRNIDLPDGIDQTLDEKEQAKQQVQVELEKVQQEEARAEQRIVQAEAEAEETRITGEALRNNPIVLDARYIEALENGEAIYVGAGDGPVLTLETSQNNSTA